MRPNFLAAEFSNEPDFARAMFLHQYQTPAMLVTKADRPASIPVEGRGVARAPSTKRLGLQALGAGKVLMGEKLTAYSFEHHITGK